MKKNNSILKIRLLRYSDNPSSCALRRLMVNSIFLFLVKSHHIVKNATQEIVSLSCLPTSTDSTLIVVVIIYAYADILI